MPLLLTELRVSALDFKLGFRMLRRYPGLTLVGGLAFAFAIAVGAAAFEVVKQMVRPTIPLPNGAEIVGLRLWDAAASRPEPRASHDFGAWKAGLETVVELGAFRTIERNLVAPGAEARPVPVAEMTASGFRVGRTPPLLGRSLVEADEQPGAPAVVVVGHDLWRSQFDADRSVVGRTVRLGGTIHTIVGVMPEGFAFPVSHALWVPLRVDPLAHGPRQGPDLTVFGRLAPGATLEAARAELATLARRAATDFPDTHAKLTAEVMPYATAITGMGRIETYGLLSVNLFLGMLLVLVCANIALLMFARAASREGEIVVRNALGASRSRIVMQLFAEALVLGGVASVVGIGAAAIALRSLLSVLRAEAGGRLPFWLEGTISPTTVLYAVGLTLLGAAIAGIVPALKVTRAVGSRLKEAAAGAGGMRFGGVWTAVIVAQVAVTVAFPAVAYFVRWSVVRIQTMEVGFASREYLSVRLELDPAPADGAALDTSRAAVVARFGLVQREIERRLEAEPGVTAATFTNLLPRTHHPQRWVEVDDPGAARADSALGARMSSAAVAPDYFATLGTSVLAGRGFHPGDLADESRTVLVNQSFVDGVLGGRNAIGRRVRFVEISDPDEAGVRRRTESAWHEIVGIVPDLGMIGDSPDRGAGVYQPLPPGAAIPVSLAVHVRGDPESFAPRLRAIAAEVDPSLRLYDVMPLDEVGATMWMEFAFLFKVLVVVSAIALVLSLAGIYAVMAFTVARRTREIGVRVALGADRRSVVLAIFRRPLAQVSAGVLAGAVLTGMLAVAVLGELSPVQVALALGYALTMLLVCMLACVVPTRRALAVEPTEALRAEG